MNTKFSAFFVLLLFVSLNAFCIRPTKEVKRVITQNYVLTNDDYYVNIENKYGHITIVEWNKPEIDFSVEITGKGEDQATAQTMAGRATVNFNQSDKRISARTVFDNKSYRCKNCGTTVHYTIRVPKNIYFNLTNKYGDIYLGTAYRDFHTEVKYGKINIQQLQGNHNKIVLKYGKINLQSVSKLELNMAYSHATIDTVEDFSLTTSYSDLKAGKISHFTLQSKYDKITVNTLDNASVSTAYSNFNIGDLSRNFLISEIRYGKICIERLAPDFENIRIDASYTPVYIGLIKGKEYNFNVDFSTRYGKIKTHDLIFHDVQLGDKEDRSTNSFKGRLGKKSDSLIQITNNYADITLENK